MDTKLLDVYSLQEFFGLFPVYGNKMCTDAIGLDFVVWGYLELYFFGGEDGHVAIDAVFCQNDFVVSLQDAKIGLFRGMAIQASWRKKFGVIHLFPVNIVAAGAIHCTRCRITLASSQQAILVPMYIQGIRFFADGLSGGMDWQVHAGLEAERGFYVFSDTRVANSAGVHADLPVLYVGCIDNEFSNGVLWMSKLILCVLIAIAMAPVAIDG